jgi:hypothetical protein
MGQIQNPEIPIRNFSLSENEGQSPVIGNQYSVISEKYEITNQKSQITNLSIPVTASDGLGNLGFTEGHPFTLKVWKASINREYSVQPMILRGASTFVKHESSLVSLKNLMTDGRWIFPNPSTGKFYIQFSGDIPERTIVSVVNSIGQEVLNCKLDSNPGVVDLTGNVSGIYFIKVKGDSWSKTEKVVLR